MNIITSKVKTTRATLFFKCKKFTQRNRSVNQIQNAIIISGFPAVMSVLEHIKQLHQHCSLNAFAYIAGICVKEGDAWDHIHTHAHTHRSMRLKIKAMHIFYYHPVLL